MERFINILLIDDDSKNIKELKNILGVAGNNLIIANDEGKVWEIIRKRKVGIIILNSLSANIKPIQLLSKLAKTPASRGAYKIIISNSSTSSADLVKGLKKGAVDYIKKPFIPNLVKAKIEVLKTLYFKDIRINQLLENIFPRNVLKDLNTVGKFSPRKVEEGVVLFTDFIAFSKSAKNLTPLELIGKLENYFNKFDEIISRYNLEKIKTIGDAYMALAGVTEDNRAPAVRASLAALEIRNYIIQQREIAKAIGETPWDIRVGIHSGPLVAGIIGAKKISFDIWGNTVNTAARAEQNSTINNITVTDAIAKHIKPYFNLSPRGKVKIKHGGSINMFFIDELKEEYSLFGEQKLPNSELRMNCDLSPMDFDYTKRYTINNLKSLLPEEMDYHSIKHTINVEKAALRIAHLEGLDDEEMKLLRTAVLYHDAGFIYQYENNEDISIDIARRELPKFGYSPSQINVISNIINATKKDVTPTSLLEKIMCDADHDYLGRPDYHIVAKTLRNELANFGKTMTDLEWIDFQLDFLENQHVYYTDTSNNMRAKGKKRRIAELKAKRTELLK